MWKKDLKKWFRQVPLDPGDYDLFGYMWRNKYYFDKVLVMGHRTSPYIAQRITNALKHIHGEMGYFLLNYIDDFMGVETGLDAWRSFYLFTNTLDVVGIEESSQKCEPPSPIMEFLGVLFNARDFTMHVTEEKIVDILHTTAIWLQKVTFTRVELEQLIGKLQFIAACVRPGRVLISRLLNTLRNTNRVDEYQLDSELKKDVAWWNKFVRQYNGVSILWLEQCIQPDSVLATDASLVGAGGVMWYSNKYYRVSFPEQWAYKNIAYLEMWAILIAVKVWGHELSGKKLILKCDNQAVVAVINNGRSRNLFLQEAMRELLYMCAKLELQIRCEYINTKINTLPDMLSRWKQGGPVRRQLKSLTKELALTRTHINPSNFKFNNTW